MRCPEPLRARRAVAGVLERARHRVPDLQVDGGGLRVEGARAGVRVAAGGDAGVRRVGIRRSADAGERPAQLRGLLWWRPRVAPALGVASSQRREFVTSSALEFAARTVEAT